MVRQKGRNSLISSTQMEKKVSKSGNRMSSVPTSVVHLEF